MTRHRRNPAPVERIVPGLDRIRAALDRTGNPEASFRAVHVAGTNGKGSTSAFAASVLGRLPGNRIGLYTSPHLLSPTERIRVDGEPIPEGKLESLLARAEALSKAIEAETGAPLSWFERMTWAAFRWFRSSRARLVVLETGLGGRWDATNSCRPAVCAITTIGIDHVEWLGGTIRSIAAEKAGIVKPGIPVVAGRLRKTARSVVAAKARESGSPLWEMGRDFGWEENPSGRISIRLPGVDIREVRLGLPGEFQKDNAAVACAAAWRVVSDRGSAEPAAFAAAAREGLSAARWSGRLSPLPGRGNSGAWADGAHNPDAAKVLAREIEGSPSFAGRKPVVALWSMLADKRIDAFVRAMAPAVDAWVAYPLAHERAASAATLERACRKQGGKIEVARDFREAWAMARAAAGPDGAVIVCGSLVAVADAYAERVGRV